MIKYNLFFVFKALRIRAIRFLMANFMSGAKCNKDYSFKCETCIQNVYGAKCDQEYNSKW